MIVSLKALTLCLAGCLLTTREMVTDRVVKGLNRLERRCAIRLSARERSLRIVSTACWVRR